MGFTFENYGHGAVAFDPYPHVGAELSGCNRQPGHAYGFDELLEHGPRDRRWRSPRKIRLGALAESTGHREVRDQKEAGPLVAQAAIEPPLRIGEQPQIAELAREPRHLRWAVATLDGNEGNKAAVDGADDAAFNFDRGGGAALDDGSHAVWGLRFGAAAGGAHIIPDRDDAGGSACVIMAS